MMPGAEALQIRSMRIGFRPDHWVHFGITLHDLTQSQLSTLVPAPRRFPWGRLAR